MIMGDCPYCDAPTCTPIAEQLPAFERLTCSTCKQEYWLAHSRLNPMAYTLIGFEESFIVDHEAKTITPRLSKLEEKELERLQEKLAPGTPGRCPCGGIVLADTEEWPIPVCDECYSAGGKSLR